MEEIERLRRELVAAANKRDYVGMNIIRTKLNKLLAECKEDITLADLIRDLTNTERYNLICMMHRVFIYSKLLGISCEDFLGVLKTIDPSAEVGIVDKSRKAIKSLNEIADIINADEVIKADFTQLMSSIKLTVDNFIYKHEAVIKKKL